MNPVNIDPKVFLKAAIAVGEHWSAPSDLKEEARALRISLGIRKDRIKHSRFTCVAISGILPIGKRAAPLQFYRRAVTHNDRNRTKYPSFWDKEATPSRQRQRYQILLMMAEVARTGL